MENPSFDYLNQLEAESIFIFREVVSHLQRPVLLYSVGKDSSVLVHLARKAFHPAPLPFPLLHIDTGFKFPEMYSFRDEFVKKIDARLHVYRFEEAIANKTSPHVLGTINCCALLKTQALLQALREGGYDAAIGGARRDEEKSRSKERIFSFRDSFGQWDPKNQRPELWNLYNTQINPNESLRVFPLSNWTEMDIWQYIQRENIPIVPLYFAQMRPMMVRNSQLIPAVDLNLYSGYKSEVHLVMSRFRTLGCIPCTGAIKSEAATVDEIIKEMGEIKTSERENRLIDHDVDSSMEQKKREGYF